MPDVRCEACFGQRTVASIGPGDTVRRELCGPCKGTGRVTPERAAEIIEERKAAMARGTAMPTYTGRSVRAVGCG